MTNPTQNEVGGKELLVKVGVEKTFSTDGTTSAITSTAHKMKVGDVAVFTAAELGSITNLTPLIPYFVKTVADANTITVAATPSGTAIIPDAAAVSKKMTGFLNLGGLRSKSFSFSSESIDISSQDTDDWKKILDAAGLRSFAVSGSGVYTNEETFQLARVAAFNNALTQLLFIDVKGLLIIFGYFKISSLDISGDYNAEGSYSLSADSSEAPNVTNL
jgi:TP901-1 family phage major tail protein